MARHLLLSASIPSALVVLALAADASAHGGAYQPPPPTNRPGPSVPPGLRGGGPTTPRNPPPVSPGPTTPSGGGSGPTTGGETIGGPAKGPTTPSGSGGRPGPTTAPGGGPSTATTPIGRSGPPTRSSGPTLSMDHWTRWWYPNRRHLIEWSTRVARANARDTTPSGAGGRATSDLWRAEVQLALHDALRDKNEDLASGAAVALGKLGDPADGGPLADVLLDERRRAPVREAAALALGLLPTEADAAEDARRALAAVARSARENDRLRAVAVYALGLRGESASLPVLLEMAHGSAASWDVPAAAVGALGLVGHDLVRPDLAEILAGPRRRRGDEAMRRAYAAQALARIPSPESVAALREAAQDSDENVRRAAALALGSTEGATDDDTMDVLARIASRDRDTGVRCAAVISIGRLGHDRGEAVLRHAYLKGSRQLRPFAALALGLYARHDGHAGAASIVIRDLEETSNAEVRAALAVAAGLSGDRAAAPILRDIVANRGDPELRGHAALALGLLDDRTEGAPLLRELLDGVHDPTLHREVAQALGMLGDREAVRGLTRLVEDGSTVFVQGSAAVALGGIGGEDAGRALLDLLRDASRPELSRAMAAVGLGLLVDPTEGRRIASVGADLSWYVFTPTVTEILTIL